MPQSLPAENPKTKFVIIPEPPRKVKIPARVSPTASKVFFSAKFYSSPLIYSGTMYYIIKSS
jgi:hypothetical protein